MFLLILLNCNSNRNVDQKNDNHIQEAVNTLVEESRNDSLELYRDFIKSGKNGIPFLINAIDNNKKGYLGFRDVTDQNLYFFYYNYVGLRAAYMIEFILSGSDKTRIYNYGVIVKSKNGVLQMDTLSYPDIQNIKSIYLKWWEKNKDKPLGILQREWQNKNNPLKDSQYYWQ